MSKRIWQIASLAAALSSGFLLGRWLFWHEGEPSSPANAPPRGKEPPTSSIPRESHSAPSSLSPRGAREPSEEPRNEGAQRDLFLRSEREARSLRYLLEWELRDRTRELRDECEWMLERDTNCWYRFELAIHGDVIGISAASLVACYQELRDGTPAPLPALHRDRLAACMAEAVGTLTELGAPSEFARNAGDYTGSFDASLFLEARGARATGSGGS